MSELSPQAEAERQRIIGMADERGDIILETSGQYVWWPAKNNGFMCAHHLRWIADELDRRNEPFEKALNDYFASHG